MNGPRLGWKRLVVGLPQGPANQAVAAAADLAEFLQLELLATFVADATLHGLAELPSVRELRGLDQRWQAIDPAQIARDIESATTLARRRFAESVGSRAVKASFDVIAGAEAMASLIRADDIVAIIEPMHPAEQITRQFAGLLEAAFALANAVLIVPRRIARRSGPVVTMTSASGDGGVQAALEIAAALKERLVLLSAAGAPPPTQLLADAERLGVAVEHIAGGALPADAALLAAASARLRERLRILPRSAVSADAHRLFASLQGIPLLVIESDRDTTTSE